MSPEDIVETLENIAAVQQQLHDAYKRLSDDLAPMLRMERIAK